MSALSKARGTDPKPVYLVSGEDEALVAGEVRTLLEDLLGNREATLVIEEHGADAQSDIDVGAVIDAYTTPPFLVDRRIVVVRDAGRLDAEGAKRIIPAFDPPPPGAVLVVVGGRGTVPAALKKSIAKVGEVIDLATRKAGEKKAWMTERVRLGPVRLTKAAMETLGRHLGDDLGRLDGLLETLASAYGNGVTVDDEMLEPFLGARGSVPIFDLTDAIDNGNAAIALNVVDRMMGPGGASSHELLASLDNHFSRLTRLDGADVTSKDEAAALLGVAPYPAQKLLALSRKVDGEAAKAMVNLIAAADLDLKGQSGLSDRMIIDILVARLSTRMKALSRR